MKKELRKIHKLMTIQKANSIKKVLCSVTGLDISKKTREQEYILARCVYYKLCKDKIEKISFSSIANPVNVDHATVMHAIEKFEEYKQYSGFLNIYKESLEILEYIDEQGLSNEIDDTIIEETNDIHKLKTKNIILSKDVSNLKGTLTKLRKKYKNAQDIADAITYLNQDQIDTLKIRIESYVKICEDQNKRNSYYINKKHETNQ